MNNRRSFCSPFFSCVAAMHSHRAGVRTVVLHTEKHTKLWHISHSNCSVSSFLRFFSSFGECVFFFIHSPLRVFVAAVERVKVGGKKVGEARIENYAEYAGFVYRGTYHLLVAYRSDQHRIKLRECEWRQQNEENLFASQKKRIYDSRATRNDESKEEKIKKKTAKKKPKAIASRIFRMPFAVTTSIWRVGRPDQIRVLSKYSVCVRARLQRPNDECRKYVPVCGTRDSTKLWRAIRSPNIKWNERINNNNNNNETRKKKQIVNVKRLLKWNSKEKQIRSRGVRAWSPNCKRLRSNRIQMRLLLLFSLAFFCIVYALRVCVRVSRCLCVSAPYVVFLSHAMRCFQAQRGLAKHKYGYAPTHEHCRVVVFIESMVLAFELPHATAYVVQV